MPVIDFRMISGPELRVTVLELRDLKHNGGHSVEVGFQGESSRSPFIDGYGAFKSVQFSNIFPLTNSQALSREFWLKNTLFLTITHQRLISSDKVVGECAIPITQAREAEMVGWFPLRYKGMTRGHVKLEIYTKNVPRPALSATNSPQPMVITSPSRRHHSPDKEQLIHHHESGKSGHQTPQVSSIWP
jgi:hypothetical protein